MRIEMVDDDMGFINGGWWIPIGQSEAMVGYKYNVSHETIAHIKKYAEKLKNNMKIENLEIHEPLMDVRNNRKLALTKIVKNEYYVFQDAEGKEYQFSEDYLNLLFERKEFIKP